VAVIHRVHEVRIGFHVNELLIAGAHPGVERGQQDEPQPVFRYVRVFKAQTISAVGYQQRAMRNPSGKVSKLWFRRDQLGRDVDVRYISDRSAEGLPEPTHDLLVDDGAAYLLALHNEVLATACEEYRAGGAVPALEIGISLNR
jgi:hypothetical protein